MMLVGTFGYGGACGRNRGFARIAVAMAAAFVTSLLLQYGALVGPAGAADPVLSLDKAVVAVEEGGTATNGGTFADAGYATEISADIGTVVQQEGDAGTWSWSYEPGDGPAEKTVTITADRIAGGKDPERATFDLTVSNVAPTAVLDAPDSAREEGSFGVSLKDASDPSREDAGALLYAFDCGDGTGYGAPGSSAGATCDSGSEPGQREVLARVTDKDGGSTEYRKSVEITDATPPETSILSGPKKLVNRTSAGFRFSSSEMGSTFQCSLDGAAFKSCDADDSLINLRSRSHSLRVRAVDGAGNVDATPAIHRWKVDAIRPTVRTLSIKNEAKVANSARTIKASIMDNSVLTKKNLRLTVGGKQVPAAKYSFRGNVFTYKALNLSAGKAVKVSATDAAGNLGAQTWRFTAR